MDRPTYEDVCKFLAIKQSQGKKCKATDVALDFMRTGKLHAYKLQKGKPSPRPFPVGGHVTDPGPYFGVDYGIPGGDETVINIFKRWKK